MVKVVTGSTTWKGTVGKIVTSVVVDGFKVLNHNPGIVRQGVGTDQEGAAKVCKSGAERFEPVAVMRGKGGRDIEFVVYLVHVLVDELVLVHPTVDPVIGGVGKEGTNGKITNHLQP